MKRCEFVIASALAIYGTSFHAASADGGLALAVEAAQTEFRVGDDPTIRVSLRNGGQTSAFFNNVYAWDLINIEIHDEAGGILEKGDKLPSPPSSHAAMVTFELKPGSEIVLHGLTENGQPRT